MYQCFHCLNNSVIWSGDFTFEDMGYEGDGIEYRIPIDTEESEGNE